MTEITGDLSSEMQTEITWKIRNFLRIPANVDSRLESAPFPLAGSDWRLELYPNGRTQFSSEGHIDVLLIRLNFSVAQQRMNATFSIQHRNGANCYNVSHNYIYLENLDRREVIRFISRSDILSSPSFLDADGTLTVLCRIIMESPPRDSGASKDESSQTDSSLEGVETVVQKLKTDYKKLLESKEDADVCLKVANKEFRAHKCILRARSSVFSAMFKHDTTEKTSGKVVIEDLDPDSFPDFLQHLYAGSIDELSEETVFNLFTAADKYDLTHLKSECKNYMKSTLSVDTFCDVIIVAFRYQEDDLLKVAIDFFAKNFKKIIVTVKWQKFLKDKNHFAHANELLDKAFITDDEE